MDEDMWHHPSTQHNLQRLESFGNHIIRVKTGELASGLYGEGRMAEPEEIAHYLEANFFRGKALEGRKALVTAGPTYEPIDPVRFIGNHSSGKMGFALARALYMQGASVQLVTGPTSLHTGMDAIEVVYVNTAQQMYDACMQVFPSVDMAVLSAAVADYRPEVVATEKIKKSAASLTLQLEKTPDILKTLGSIKKPGQLLVGFALETNNEVNNALHKLESKHADMIVLNSLRNKDAGFGVDTNAVTLYMKNGTEHSIGVKSKDAIAVDIVQHMIQLLHAKS